MGTDINAACGQLKKKLSRHSEIKGRRKMVGIKSDVGIVRNLNEDYAGYIEEEEYKLYVVADGMGGHNAGEVASEMAVEVVKSYVKENYKNEGRNVLENAILYANKNI